MKGLQDPNNILNLLRQQNLIDFRAEIIEPIEECLFEYFKYIGLDVRKLHDNFNNLKVKGLVINSHHNSSVLYYTHNDVTICTVNTVLMSISKDWVAKANTLTAKQCVLDLKGAWPDKCDRYLYLTNKGDWSTSDNDIAGQYSYVHYVYYQSFIDMCEKLGVEFKYEK